MDVCIESEVGLSVTYCWQCGQVRTEDLDGWLSGQMCLCSAAPYVTHMPEGCLAVFGEEQVGRLHIARGGCGRCGKPRVVVHTNWTGDGGRLTTYCCAHCGAHCAGHGTLVEMEPEAYRALVVWEERVL